MVNILDGRALSARIRDKIKERVKSLPSQPGLGVLLVGSDPASHTYVGLKRKACEEAGIRFEQFLYFATEPEQSLINKIRELNERTDIHGILVQLPLPVQNADAVIASIDPRKDVDGFHPENLRRLQRGEPAIVSAVALGIMRLIREAVGTAPLPRQATIVSSPLFAEPIQWLLKESGAGSIVVQADDPTLAEKTRMADILVVAVGHPHLITASMVKPGSIVIDVGITRTDHGIQGDVDFDSVVPIAGAITPVPGGVGPMTVAMLLVNILKAYDIQRSSTDTGF